MKMMMIILFSMILTENFVLVKFLGICSFLGISKDLKSSLGMSYAVIVVMVIASAATWVIQKGLLEVLHLEFLQTLVFILVIAALVQLVELVIKKTSPTLYNILGVYLPLITTNCAVLGVALLNVTQGDFTFFKAIIQGLGAGIGYLVAMVLFSGVQKMLLRCKPPKAFEGLPITLVAAALTSLAFTGFTGIVENIFG